MKCADDCAMGGANEDKQGDPGSAGILRLDADLGIVSLDGTASRMIGIVPDNLLGRRVGELFDLANLGNLMRSGIGFSNQLIRVNARRMVCDYVPILEDDRLAGGVLSLLRVLPEDVTGSSDELGEILRSTNSFLNFDHDGIIVVDRKGIVVLVNQSFARLFDTTPQAMIGKHVHEAYSNNSQPSRMPMVMETGKPEIGIPHYLNGKQVYASIFPLLKEGRVIGCVGKILFSDIREITLIANRLQAAAGPRKQHRNVPGTEIHFKYDINSIVGQSRKIVELKEILLRVALKTSNILLRGESGTGKELFAHAIHSASTRRYAPFVSMNCAAIPEHLLESELFGYVEGAFTGAKRGGQLGRFEQAHTGTIFLDEIGDMPLYMQAKMLRLLQERELTPLGCSNSRSVDVRVVAATNSNLEQQVKEGRFREDLYYRLNVVTLAIPPLRERMEDIPFLVSSFIGKFNAEFGLDVQGLDDEAWDVVRRYDWPGNIRELRNVIESAFNVIIGPLIRREHLPEQLCRLFPREGMESSDVTARGAEEFIRANLGKKDIGQIVDDFEKLLIHEAIGFSHGNKVQAAQLLGISRQGLYKKLHKYAGEAGDEV
ncbi:sigma-54 interaction domain-containing protein [Geobacter pickeringii]|uniref:Fis family transcriptional regulator n=1 Tax=Geobacter pickeringii TaxID=345632 RepID=A0A0B5BHL0_9BACT|nr:sigma-54-dependent Fis family transcriptional regulator [Geobacter pickeringii]AJE03521.1 Fis family transcriptional regulator [Geobacter pickeringii]